MDIDYEQTEYDRITPPIVKRYKSISQERGRTVIPVASDGSLAPEHEHYRREDREPGIEDQGVGEADEPDDGSSSGFFGFRGERE